MNTIPILHHLKPNDNQRNSKIAWDVGPARPAHAASVKSVGIFGQMTGSRATDIIADDVEVPGNSATQDAREKLLKATSEFEAILTPDETSQITFLGTPQSEETIYNKIRKREYSRRIWPARVPTADKLGAYYGDLDPEIQKMFEQGKHWQPTDPLRFNDEELTTRQLTYGNSGFMLQFMLDTTLSDQERYPLKLSDLIVMNTHNEKAPILVQYGSGQEQAIKDLKNIGFTGDRFYRPLFMDTDNWAPYEGSVMYIDPSGRGTDQTAYAVVKQLHGMLFVTDVGGFQGGYEDTTLLMLARVAKYEKVNEIVIESNFGDGMFAKLFLPVLKKYHNCAITEDRSKTQKELRIIDTLEPVMNRHKLIVNEEVVRREQKLIENDEKLIHYNLFYQMTRLTKDRGSLKHDDKIDALAGAVQYWLNSMSRDETEAVADWKANDLEKSINDFLGHVLGLEEGSSALSSGGNQWNPRL